MTKTIVIHQPDFAPYIGYFHRLLLADHFIYLDDAQFARGGWQNRDQVKGANGARWLTLSVKKTGNLDHGIRDVELDPATAWIDSNLNLIRECYRKARFFSEVFPQVEAIYRAGYVHMMDFNLAFLALCYKYFDISISTSFASSYNVEAKSTARLVELVQHTGGSDYLTGTGSRAYLDESLFEAAGMRVHWQNFQHPVYPQLYGDFLPMLSSLDVIFNCGPDSAAIVRSIPG